MPDVSREKYRVNMLGLVLAASIVALPGGGYAQTTIAPSPILTPLPTITEPQPESRVFSGGAPTAFPAPAGATSQGATTGIRPGGSDRLFSAPVDPDTQEIPNLGLRGSGEGGRIRLPGDNNFRPGARAAGRTNPNGRALRLGDPGFNVVPPVRRSDGDLIEDGRILAARRSEIDGDLRNSFDDDLLVEQPRLGDLVRTGPTVGASRLLTRRDNLLGSAADGFTVRARQAYPEDDDLPFEPLGVRLGAFRILPTLTATSIVTDNVANASGRAESDVGVELRPTLRIESDWNRHSLTFDANGSAVFYNEFDTENSKQFSVSTRARLDLTLRSNIELDAGYQLVTEQRGSANSTSGALEAPDVETLQAGIALNHRFNRLVTRTRIGYFEEINGDAQLGNSNTDLGADEDFSQWDIASRLTYEFSPSFAAFVEGAYNQQRFDIGADADGIIRDSDGYEVRLGVTTEIGPAIRAEVSAGYMIQRAEATQLNDIDGFAFDADLLWRPSALTSVNLTAQTDINTSTLAGSLGTIQYQTALNIRHEFRRYAIGTLGFGWQREDFRDANVTEDALTFQLGGEYLFSRSLVALASYQFTDFSSTQPNSDYQTNEFRIGLQVRR